MSEKGSTLIGSLLAFMIYVSVIVMLVSLFSSVYKTMPRLLKQKQQDAHLEIEIVNKSGGDALLAIEEVLR